MAGSQYASEAEIQQLIHDHPECLPIAEIDPNFSNPVPICRELNTPAGPIDNLLVTPGAQPVIVECKLWKNPEGRREVVGQILDYAKELTRWSSSDLQREVTKRLKESGNALLKEIRNAGHDVDEIAFNDALTLNLRKGRFLLLVVGDGIREGVEAIAAYLQQHMQLPFSFGLIELPIYQLPGGDRLVVPRVLARTVTITRTVIAMPDGFALQDDVSADSRPDSDQDHSALANEQQQFWSEFLKGLILDDPEQPIPRPARQGYLTFMLPAPAGSSWLTVWRDLKAGQVGLYLSSSRASAGEAALQSILLEAEEIQAELGGTAHIGEVRGRATVQDWLRAGDLSDARIRARAFTWLRERVNVFVNVLRPRVRRSSQDS